MTLEELMVRMDITDSINKNAIRGLPVSVLRFNDGVTINTSGELRCIRLKDGLYVVGEGMCIPVDTREEAKEYIENFKGE